MLFLKIFLLSFPILVKNNAFSTFEKIIQMLKFCDFGDFWMHYCRVSHKRIFSLRTQDASHTNPKIANARLNTQLRANLLYRLVWVGFQKATLCFKSSNFRENYY
jgi:hypothetical protein